MAYGKLSRGVQPVAVGSSATPVQHWLGSRDCEQEAGTQELHRDWLRFFA